MKTIAALFLMILSNFSIANTNYSIYHETHDFLWKNSETKCDKFFTVPRVTDGQFELDDLNGLIQYVEKLGQNKKIIYTIKVDQNRKNIISITKRHMTTEHNYRTLFEGTLVEPKVTYLKYPVDKTTSIRICKTSI